MVPSPFSLISQDSGCLGCHARQPLHQIIITRSRQSPDQVDHQIQMITRSSWSPDPNHRLNNHCYHFTVSNSLPHQKHSMYWASKNKESFSIKTSKSLIEKPSSNINCLQLATFVTLLLPSGWLSVSASEHSSTLCKISRKVEKEKRIRARGKRNLSCCWRVSVKPCWEIWKTKFGQNPLSPGSTCNNNMLMSKMSCLQGLRLTSFKYHLGKG